MELLSYNLLRDATLTASSANDQFPVDNVYSKRKMQLFKFAGFNSETLTAYKSGQSFNAVIIDNHNLTTSAVVKFQANDTDVWTSPSIDETLSIDDAITYLWDSVQSYNYVRLTFEDPTNTEAIYIGMAFLANSDNFSIAPGWDLSSPITGRATYQTFSATFTGLSAAKRTALKTAEGNLAGTISISDTRQQFGTAWPGYIVVDEDDLNILPVYGILSAMLSLTRATDKNEVWDGSISWEELF